MDVSSISTYAEQHEKTRKIGFYVRVGCLIPLIASFAIRDIPIWLRAALVIVFVGILGMLLRAMLSPREPRELTVLTSRDGTWKATAPIFALTGAVDRPGRARPEVELLGRVRLTPTSVLWEPNHASAKNLGARNVEWDSTWTVAARRLSGAGQVHLCLVRPGDATVDLWLHGASALPIP